MLQRSKSPFRAPKPPKPSRKVGKVTHTIRLAGPEMTDLRKRVYWRSKGICERNLPGCQRYTPWKSGNLSHIGSRGAGHSDTEENTLWSCLPCHSKSHNCDGKPIKISKVSCGVGVATGIKEGLGPVSTIGRPGAKPASSVAGEERSGESRPQEKLS